MEYPLTEGRRRLALDLLTPVIGQRPTIVGEVGLGHQWAPVTRLTLDREVPGFGPSVIVKTRRVEDDGYGGAPHLRREQVGLRLAEESGVAPRLIAADDAVGVVIQSDMGTWPTLESVLMGDDAVAAEAGVIDLARALGRLHATTVGVEDQHREALLALGSADPSTFRLGHWPGIAHWSNVEAAALELGFPDATVARVDVAQVIRELTETSQFIALLHGDINPTNVLVTDAGVRLVDFEQSIFGHVGRDLAALQFPFAGYSANWAIFPDRVTAAADRAYRLEVSPSLPDLDTDQVDRALAIGAGSHLATRVQRLNVLARDDQPAMERWRRRAQMVQHIRVFERLAARADCLHSMASWFSTVADEMTARWPDATSPPPPLYPAFGGARWRETSRVSAT